MNEVARVEVNIRWLLLGAITLIGIFLLSNSRQLFLGVQPDQIKVMVNSSISLQKVSEMLPGSKILNEKAGLSRFHTVSFGSTKGQRYDQRRVPSTVVPLDTPIISWRYYSYTVKVSSKVSAWRYR